MSTWLHNCLRTNVVRLICVPTFSAGVHICLGDKGTLACLATNTIAKGIHVRSWASIRLIQADSDSSVPSQGMARYANLEVAHVWVQGDLGAAVCVLG